MTPAAQAEEEERERIAMAKKLRCIDCDSARAWCVGGTNMQTGYCTLNDMPLSSSEAGTTSTARRSAGAGRKEADEGKDQVPRWRKQP